MEYTTVVEALCLAIRESERDAPNNAKHLALVLKETFVSEVGDLPLVVLLKDSVRVGAVEIKWLVESQRWSIRKSERWYEGEELADLLIQQLPPMTLLPPPATFFRGTRNRILEKLGGVGQAFSDYSGLLTCLLDVAIAARHLRKVLTLEGHGEAQAKMPKAQILKPLVKSRALKGGAPPSTRATTSRVKDPEDLSEAIEQLDESLRRLDAHARSMNL